jgi:hypothetical protein
VTEGCGLDVGEGARIGHAGVVDQAGCLAELRLGVADGTLQRSVVGDISLRVDGAIRRQPVERLHVTRDQQQSIAFLGKGAGDGEADAGARSCNDDKWVGHDGLLGRGSR